VSDSPWDQLRDLRREIAERRADNFLISRPEAHRPQLLELLPRATAQILQDLFVLSELGFKRNGFFVEFGACDGLCGSNTFLLESEFAWNGILAEPARVWHEELRAQRRALISTQCVWSHSGQTLTFNQADWAGLSTIASFNAADRWATQRLNGLRYDVETVSLNDLLAGAGAPDTMDYLSIDTEGSELRILQAFDFSRYRFSIITCEHNFTPAREAIAGLLARQGYVRKNQGLSQFDDWYIHQDALIATPGR
jgi:FkbM family methyltransferase